LSATKKRAGVRAKRGPAAQRPVRLVPAQAPDEAASPIPDNAFTRESRRLAEEKYLGAISDVVSGGLWTVNDDPMTSCHPGDALCRVAGSLLKAVTLARFAASDDELPGWSPSSRALTDAEMQEALSGIGALLRNAPTILDHLRAIGGFRDSHVRHPEGSVEP